MQNGNASTRPFLIGNVLLCKSCGRKFSYKPYETPTKQSFHQAFVRHLTKSNFTSKLTKAFGRTPKHEEIR